MSIHGAKLNTALESLESAINSAHGLNWRDYADIGAVILMLGLLVAGMTL